jgi:hypothetical protein
MNIVQLFEAELVSFVILNLTLANERDRII